jgi:hypothetical protein
MKGAIHEVDETGRAEAAVTLEAAALDGRSQMRYEHPRDTTYWWSIAASRFGGSNSGLRLCLRKVGD